MASDHEDSRRRPQPIDVPGFTYPASASSAPNDFGVAAQSERSVNPKQQEQNGLQSPTVRLPRSTSTKSASSKNRDPESTTVTGLMDRARGLSVPATSRRHRATQSSPTTALTGEPNLRLKQNKNTIR
ncbi:hypothetical protein DM02DRAFT_609886 [Periconia macrospinosa]|uniref:Uncharacterized protein n=1 Tax=Periconia macrospinosa TaxID=97972 RepID=A0A2V1E6Y9_9PLEO|nr:hypothetical protein DM02DRAFT_609886 [Periconia macrospinosa]